MKRHILTLVMLMFATSAIAAKVNYQDHISFADGSEFTATFTFDSTTGLYSDIAGTFDLVSPSLSLNLDTELFSFYNTPAWGGSAPGYSQALFINPVIPNFYVAQLFLIDANGILSHNSDLDTFIPNGYYFDNVLISPDETGLVSAVPLPPSFGLLAIGAIPLLSFKRKVSSL